MMFCKRCRYNLGSATRHRCPECGRAFDPADPRTYRASLSLPWGKIRGGAALAVGIALMVAGLWSGLLQITYFRAVDNDPLLAPVDVRLVEGNTFVLADGRKFTVDYWRDGESLEETIRLSDYRVDVEAIEGQDSIIYAKGRRFICGTAWANGLIRIPLIPDDVYVNRRKMVGYAQSVSSNPAPGFENSHATPPTADGRTSGTASTRSQ